MERLICWLFMHKWRPMTPSEILSQRGVVESVRINLAKCTRCGEER